MGLHDAGPGSTVSSTIQRRGPRPAAAAPRRTAAGPGCRRRRLAHPAAHLGARRTLAPALFAFVERHQGARRQAGAHGRGLGSAGVDRRSRRPSVLKTLRRPDTTLRWIQATAPSGSQILRHSRVSAITCTGRPRGAVFPQDAVIQPRALARADLATTSATASAAPASPVGVGRPSGMVWPAPP